MSQQKEKRLIITRKASVGPAKQITPGQVIFLVAAGLLFLTSIIVIVG
jgi:hypothetical protein